ncbi:unnamed protein product [Caenorhabditis auriculariae]|uniref:Uncharacterized protein n=1 Tax=Caenorhabditis auriculariae TaxID=2777116 RepID=A0A8S1GS41_9PELO|nr:unnamed protein product [Caenorhabditis auriculariae]
MFGITGNEDRKADQRTPKTPSKFDRGRFSVDSSVPIFTTDCDDGFMPFFPNPAFRGDPSLLNKTKDEFDIVREDHLFAVYEPNDGRNLELLSEPKTEVSEDAFEEKSLFGLTKTTLEMHGFTRSTQSFPEGQSSREQPGRFPLVS